MNDILEIIDDLEMLNALDPVGREAHIQHLLEKYNLRVEEFERAMADQMSFDLVN